MEELGCDLGLLHIPAHFHIVGLLGKGALAEALGLGNHAVAQGDREILPAIPFDGLDDLGGKPVAVFQGAAVVVGALVGVFEGELVQGIAFVYRMDLNAVHPGLLAQLGGFGKGFDDLLDLRHGKGPGIYPVRPAVGSGGGGSQDEVHIEDGLAQEPQRLVFGHLYHDVVHRHGPAEAGGQLDEQLGPGLMKFLHKGFEGLELGRVLIEPAAAHGIPDGGDTGEQKPHVVPGPLQ